MTRAAFSLLFLRFSDALYYHPLIFLMPTVVAALLLQKRIPAKTYKFLIFTTIVMFGTVYVVRLLDPSNGSSGSKIHISHDPTFHPLRKAYFKS